jgi:hypothetical protein
VEKRYTPFLKQPLSKFFFKCYVTAFIFSLTQAAVSAQSTDTLAPVADAFVRDGDFAAINYGSDTTLVVKGSATSGLTRFSYLKFSLATTPVTNIGSARLRIYGRNAENTASIKIVAFGVDDDSWTEDAINFTSAPVASTPGLSSNSVSAQSQYYDLDVTEYVKAQLGGDKVVSLLVRDTSNQGRRLVFNSKEYGQNPPQLIIGPPVQSDAFLFVQNLDAFPANDRFVFSRVQIPYTRDTVYNTNHDTLTVRLRNKGRSNLVIRSLSLSDDSSWKFVKLRGVDYDSATAFPLTVAPAGFADLTVAFVAVDSTSRVKILRDTLTIVSNDDNFPAKTVFFSGLLQRQGEGEFEPHAQEIINAFGFKTSVGFQHSDPDSGDVGKPKGDEILPSFFVRADTSRPVSIRQMAAYHSCCHISDPIFWYAKGSSTYTNIFGHYPQDAQSLLPKKYSGTSPAQGTISPQTPFGFRIGYIDNTDPSKNPSGKIAVRVWKAIDADGNPIANSYIISDDHAGNRSTNYDYNDNMYFISNIKPDSIPASSSDLNPTPSDLDFGEHILQTDTTLQLKLSSLGRIYNDTTSDPAIKISSISIRGENSTEFSAAMPEKTTLNAQDSTTLTVHFKPVTQGLKIADLLIYYNNSLSPLRVPLYGIGRSSDTMVVVNYRINSGSPTPITLNGKTWAADNQYAFDNIEPYTNPLLHQIAGTDEDSLYLKEQSSNGDRMPFRYEFPIENGDYVVRLHFAEIYWGAPGAGFSGGVGSRVMNIALENQLRLVNFDVTQEAGGGATALVKNIPVTVTDGKLNIDFSANVNRPMVVAVEVVSFRASSVLSSQDPVVNVLPEGNHLKKAKVYPNPLQKRFKVEFPGQYSGNTTLQLTDAIGRVYQLGKFKLQRGSASNVEVDISNLSLKPGFYYLKVLSETRPAEVIKLVIE